MFLHLWESIIWKLTRELKLLIFWYPRQFSLKKERNENNWDDSYNSIRKLEPPILTKMWKPPPTLLNPQCQWRSHLIFSVS
jgi:hypothetical protein